MFPLVFFKSIKQQALLHPKIQFIIAACLFWPGVSTTFYLHIADILNTLFILSEKPPALARDVRIIKSENGMSFYT